MSFGECKVYNDGSHYIAIPYKPNHARKRQTPPEELITVVEDIPCAEAKTEPTDKTVSPVESHAEVVCERGAERVETSVNQAASTPKAERKITRKELFEQLYSETNHLKRTERKKIIYRKMRPYFDSENDCEFYVQRQFERKQKNLICRRVRLARKVNLADFNYFCTFTYDSAKHTEESFKKGLKQVLRNMTYRKKWRYAGVWERSPTSGRLHFHGMFDIPKGTIRGTFTEVIDYNTTKHKRQTAMVNSYFSERFGRNDFKEIDGKATLGEAMAYLTKYIEKTGEKIVYSKNLPMFFISDIMDDDVVCRIGQEERKLLLYDDFGCWDEGCYMGTVSPEVIKQMRKSN